MFRFSIFDDWTTQAIEQMDGWTTQAIDSNTSQIIETCVVEKSGQSAPHSLMRNTTEILVR